VALAAALATPGAAAVLPFSDAARLVLERGPEGAAARVTLEGARAYARSAGGLPGPSIAADVENFGGRGPFQNLDSAEITLSASQPLRFGPRASARRSLAQAEAELAAARLDAATRLQLAGLMRLYAAAAAAGERAGVAAKRETLATQLQVNARRRLAAGDIAEVEARRVDVEAALAASSGEAAHLEAQAAQETLARFVGEPDVTASADWLPSLGAGPTPALRGAAALADEAIWDAERAVAARGEAEARAERLPTADLMVGVRRFRDADATTAVAGVTLGVPLWNGNRGSIARAAAAARRTGLEGTIKARDARSRAGQALAAWEAAAVRLGTIEQSALPAARRALELSQRGYTAGALPYRDLADAAQTLIGIEDDRVTALDAIAGARATLLELTGDLSLAGLPSGPVGTRAAEGTAR
jgi:cobalt-zinc-cadmium efflux system outer membrane protein